MRIFEVPTIPYDLTDAATIPSTSAAMPSLDVDPEATTEWEDDTIPARVWGDVSLSATLPPW